jgi:DNA-binding protein YbaB
VYRESARDVQESAESDNGLISAAVNGRGELVGLELNPRIFRVHDSRALADDIAETIRRAGKLVNERLGALAAELVFDQHTERQTPRDR